ncbi:hypothetical protein [Christiangramia salexigens]|uniref:hypothetical protein n=1 Tax=Christiangramia salexigens TaxID=1913577 RepID=UPI00268CACC0
MLNTDYIHRHSGADSSSRMDGYRINEEDEVQLGLSQVPFGIQQYNSHNWFFNLTYYMGLEDDHDMGVKFLHVGDDFEYQLAFYKNSEELQFGALPSPHLTDIPMM